jgi:ABC-type transporter Mla subunit MlaD
MKLTPDNLRYLARVAKTDVMRNHLNAAADTIERQAAEIEQFIADRKELVTQLQEAEAELTEAQDLAGHWAIATLEAQHQVRELRAQLDALANQEPVVATKSWIDPKDLKVVTEYIRANDFYKPQPAAVSDDGMRKAAEFLRIERDAYRRQRDIAVAALERMTKGEFSRHDVLAREALKEIGEIK